MKPQHTAADFGYLTTTGRRSGRPHTVEIWFAAGDGVVYLLSGGGRRSDWCQNLEARPDASFRIARTEYEVRGRRVTGRTERALARRLVFEKYDSPDSGDLTGWRDSSEPYALDLID
ncbi:MAG TPA: nitroreductase family deazaflavin-dependent oxidoreductase [Acidimicrobiia bacterium]|nr:nitroreductase family deazaflavin-dependent oxidoreductase [Acidimicrobiia bacterium]